MTISYLLRHGRTALSHAYVANGDPSTAVLLDAVGISQCHRAAVAPWLATVSTCVVSEFRRTHQTADLIVPPSVPRLIEPRLNEINYGCFEGGPWLAYGAWLRDNGVDVPPPGGEARQAAIRRILLGLGYCLTLPGPRLVVGHGLMISAILQLRQNASLDKTDLPESPYVAPLPLVDQDLRDLINSGLDANGAFEGRAQPAGLDLH